MPILRESFRGRRSWSPRPRLDGDLIAGPWIPSGFPGPRRGFTLIELMVVIAIIVLAAGLMTPTITDFFKNRQLERIRGEFGASFNSARLKAVNEGVPTSLVFFKDGFGIYDERKKQFCEELARPESSLLASEQMWYVLGFEHGRANIHLPTYSRWKDSHSPQDTGRGSSRTGGTAGASGGGGSRDTGPGPAQSITGLPKITFNRDGSINFATGSDVSSAIFNKEEVPSNADIIIYQASNTTACFIDLRGPGQMRCRVVPISQIPTKPAEGETEETGRSRSSPSAE